MSGENRDFKIEVKVCGSRVLVQFAKWHGRPGREDHAQDARATSQTEPLPDLEMPAMVFKTALRERQCSARVVMIYSENIGWKTGWRRP